MLNDDECALFVRMAGYRNRLVHVYDRVSEAELFAICTERLADVERVLASFHEWIRRHPEHLDRGL